jgi:hypothetical protein
MKKNEFYQLLAPLTDKLYRFAFNIIPDDLQAEQLLIDCLNAYLLKEKKNIIKKEVNLLSKKEAQILRRNYFKGLLRLMSEIGVRRSFQLGDQLKKTRPNEYSSFFSLEPKIRMVMTLRYDAQFTVEEILDVLQLPRHEVIEKIHNGRFLLLNNLNKGVSL